MVMNLGAVIFCFLFLLCLAAKDAKVAKSLCSFVAEMFTVTCFGVVLTQRHEGSEVFEGLESSA
jgi:hypothetical protein